MTKAEQKEKVRQLLTEALTAVHEASTEWGENPPNFTSREELAHLHCKLAELRDSLENDISVEVPGLWRPIADTWPYTNKLGQKIVEAELAYERLMRK